MFYVQPQLDMANGGVLTAPSLGHATLVEVEN